MNIIVIELERDKFFVELAKKSAEEVFAAHLDGKVECIFTQKFRPLSFILESTDGSKDKFQEVIFSYMLDFGIENVRGGEFGELFFTRERRNEIKERIAVKFEKCFNCLGNHRIKRCTKALDVNEDLKEFIDEIMDGDSSGDEKIGEEDMTEDEKLALKMQLGQFDEHDGESVNMCHILLIVGAFVVAFYAFIYIIISTNGKKKLKVSFNTGYG